MLTFPKIAQKKLAPNNHALDSLENWKHYPICPTTEDKATGNDLAVDDAGTRNLARSDSCGLICILPKLSSWTHGYLLQ